MRPRPLGLCARGPHAKRSPSSSDEPAIATSGCAEPYSVRHDVVVLASATTLALGSRRISAEQSAYTAPSAGRCTPTTLNVSAVLPGTSLAVSPLPDSYDASPQTQISLLGAPRARSARPRERLADRLALRGIWRLLAGRRRELRARQAVRARRDGDGARQRADRLEARSRSPSTSWSPTRTRRSRRPLPPARRTTQRVAALPVGPELKPPVVRRRRSPRARAGRPVRGAVQRAGPERADDLRRSRQPRLVPPAGVGHRRHEPAGAAVRRPAGADLVAGPHPAAGLWPGRRDHRQHLLPADRRVRAGNGFLADLHEFRITPEQTRRC